MNSILIDTAKWIVCVKVDKIEKAEFLAEIYKLPEYVIIDEKKRSLAMFNIEQLECLCENHNIKLRENLVYNQKLTLLHEYINEKELYEVKLSTLRKKLGRDIKDVPHGEKGYNSETEKPRKLKNKMRVQGSVTGRINKSSAEIKKPKEGSVTGRVWEICEEYRAYVEKNEVQLGFAVGSKQFRAVVIKGCAKEEINSSTAATQYAKWKKYNNI